MNSDWKFAVVSILTIVGLSGLYMLVDTIARRRWEKKFNEQHKVKED